MSDAQHQRWEVVGGSDTGGIMVRKGCDIKSAALDQRLSTGAIVVEEEFVGNRLRYTKLHGAGPERGWVSILFKDRTLLVKIDQQQNESEANEMARLKEVEEARQHKDTSLKADEDEQWAPAEESRLKAEEDRCQNVAPSQQEAEMAGLKASEEARKQEELRLQIEEQERRIIDEEAMLNADEPRNQKADAWIRHVGLPRTEGTDLHIDKEGVVSVEDMRKACMSHPECVGFAHFPKEGWWFPKQINTGFDPIDATYRQWRNGETWEWHYIRDRAQVDVKLEQDDVVQSIVKDEARKSPEEWRSDIAKYREVKNDDMVIKTLQDGSEALLKDGVALEEAMRWAREAAMHYRKIGSRWRLGVVLDRVAKLHLQLRDGLVATEVDDEGTSMQERKKEHLKDEHLKEALGISTEAVTLLKRIGHSREEESLASARATLSEARSIAEADKASKARSKSTMRDDVKEPSLQENGEEVAEANIWIKHDGLPRIEGEDLHIGKEGIVSVEDMRIACKCHPNCLGFAYFPRKGLWFPKQTNTGFDPITATYSQRRCGEIWEWHYIRDRAQAPFSSEELNELNAGDADADEESKGMPITLCPECLLPLGSTKYASKDGEGFLHGECVAKNMIYNSKEESDTWKEEEVRKKSRNRVEYNIGWRPDRMVPSNADFLRERGVPVPPGATDDSMYCLVLEGGDTPMVKLMPTEDSESSLILEYLVLALQVRIKNGMAPYFSLDTPRADEQWQVKTFGPPWLKGTSVGEVLFQADYHLKELSMGDCLFEQPVTGMKSCWDFDWSEEWRGREWFVVKEASVTISEKNVLIPYVKMGVEARETEVNEKMELVDKPVTSKAHPLVKYAEFFSHYFDLIAERKSVIFFLREVSRAAIVAKFLLDNKIPLGKWLLEAYDKTDVCKMELPFNKQERKTYEILVCDGAIKEVQGGILQSMTCLSGGVDLNIDAFDFTTTLRLNRSVQDPKHADVDADQSTTRGSSKGLGKLTQRELRKLIQEAGGQAPHGLTEKTDLIDLLVSLRLEAECEADVDTQEEKHDESLAYLSDVEEDLRKVLHTEETVRTVIDIIRRRAHAAKSKAFPANQRDFWDRLGDACENSKLLNDVFNGRFCDRRQEKRNFVPPSTTEGYLKSLHSLIEEEKQVREKRRQHFLSKEFSPEAPGTLFPSSWKDFFRLRAGRGSSVAAAGEKQRRNLLESDLDGNAVVKETRPMFDRITNEDGTRFRIYLRGSTEVRTTQDGELGEEVIGAVFQIQSGVAPKAIHPIMKVTLFVKSLVDALQVESQPDPVQAYSYFVVFETDLGDVLLMEKLLTGRYALEENPGDADERYAWARVLNTSDCSGMGTTVGDVRDYYQQVTAGAAIVSGKRFAQDAFDWAGGTPIVHVGRDHILQVPEMHTRGAAPPPAQYGNGNPAATSESAKGAAPPHAWFGSSNRAVKTNSLFPGFSPGVRGKASSAAKAKGFPIRF